MTKTVNFCLPRLGGAESEARILAWKKSEGEPFKAGESILDVETDKAVVEVPAPCDGVMGQQLAAVDSLVEFDQVLAEIAVNGDAAEEAGETKASVTAAQKTPPSSPAKSNQTKVQTPATPAAIARESGSARPSIGASNRRAASPKARKLAQQMGVDLLQINGSGINGRIVRDDIEQLADQVPYGAAQRTGQSAGSATVSEKLIRTQHGEIFVRFWNVSGQTGSATTVLVHGLFGDIDAWAGLASSLASQGRSVVAIDLPAHGKTPAKGFTIVKIVAALAEVLATLPSGPKILVGHSLGGAIAAKLAAKLAAGELSSLALIAPAGLGTEINQSYINGMLNAQSTEILRRELEKIAVRLPALGSDFLSDLLASLKQRSSSLHELISDFSYSGVQQVDVRADLERLSVPITIFWGRQDQIIPWSHALNATPKAALHLIPGVGHMPQWESGSLVVERLLQLLSSSK